MGSKMQVGEFMEAMILDRSAWEIGESLERGGVIRGGEGGTWEGGAVDTEL